MNIKQVIRVNYVIIFAGSVGTRMKIEMPKQFLNVDDKPILVFYTN